MTVSPTARSLSTLRPNGESDASYSLADHNERSGDCGKAMRRGEHYFVDRILFESS